MADVVIVGGGVMGCSTAYHLLIRDPAMSVVVVEKDPTYEFAASARSNAGIRVLFSQEENLLMSMFGHEFYADFAERMAVDGQPADFKLNREGYLFIANTAEQAADYEANFALQQAHGCDSLLLDAKGVAERFPLYETGDILCAAYGPNDGWVDAYSTLSAYRRKARSLGADFRQVEVVGVRHDARRVRGVELHDGTVIAAEMVINATGARAPEICAMVGMTIPVVPLCRDIFYVEPPESIAPPPTTIDGFDLGIRGDPRGVLCGATDRGMAGGFRYDPDHSYFEETVWPKLAHRMPLFERLKVKGAWSCHYALNSFDGNMIIGPWIGGLANFLIATGFSGHGFQHAPAVGRALAELVLDGDFQTIDLSRLTYQRILDDDPYPERGATA